MKRLPLVLSATALVVAVFGSTPVGHAVGSAIPAFAKSAGYAKQAGNASALNGIKASKQARPGMLVPLGTDGKFPSSVGLVGPAGPAGPKGDRGDRGDTGAVGPKGATGQTGPVGARGPSGPSGISGWSYFTRGASLSGESFKTVNVDCPAGKKALGGGVAVTSGLWAMRVIQSAPSGAAATGWLATVANDASNFTTSFYVWAICGSVS